MFKREVYTKAFHIFLTENGGQDGKWANVIYWASNMSRLLFSLEFHICISSLITPYIWVRTFFPSSLIQPHVVEKSRGVGRVCCSMIASLLPHYQLRQVLTGCCSTLSSQNSWHHPAGSRETLLQGETWVRKKCFDPNRAMGKSSQKSILTPEWWRCWRLSSSGHIGKL